MRTARTGLVALLLASSIAGFTAAKADNSPLKIGVLAPSTGASSITGAPFEQGARLLLDDMQKNGLNGHPVQFTFFDTEGAGPKAVQLFNRLIDNDDVDIVLGPVNSGESIAVAPLANQLKVPVLCICSAEAITKPATPYVFGLAPVDAVVVDELLGVLKGRNVKTVSLIYSLDAYGQSGGKIIESRLASFGLQLSNVETFAPGDNNMTAQLLSIRGKNPDAIILWSAANPAPAIILKSAKDLGITTQFYLGNAAAFNGFVDQAGPAADGAFVASLPILAPEVLGDDDPRKSILADFTKSYKARWGKAPDQTAGGAMDGVLIIQEAVKMIPGPITRQSLRDAVEKVKMCGSYGCRQFTAEDHRGHGNRATTALMQIKDSKWQPIKP